MFSVKPKVFKSLFIECGNNIELHLCIIIYPETNVPRKQTGNKCYSQDVDKKKLVNLNIFIIP